MAHRDSHTNGQVTIMPSPSRLLQYPDTHFHLSPHQQYQFQETSSAFAQSANLHSQAQSLHPTTYWTDGLVPSYPSHQYQSSSYPTHPMYNSNDHQFAPPGQIFHPRPYVSQYPAHRYMPESQFAHLAMPDPNIPSPIFGVFTEFDHSSQSSASRPPTAHTHSRHTSSSTIEDPSAHRMGHPIQSRSISNRSQSNLLESELPQILTRRQQATLSHPTPYSPGTDHVTEPTPSPPPKPTRAKTKPKSKGKKSKGKKGKSSYAPTHTIHPAPLESDSISNDTDGEEGEDPYHPGPNIDCDNITYPLLKAPEGTMYSINNCFILTPANYVPPGSNATRSVHEQYSCRLCRKAYHGQNARSVARRHLQDIHHVALALQEKKCRWDQSKLPQRPRNETERIGRNRASKAEWARKKRVAERRLIEEANLDDQQSSYMSTRRDRKGKGVKGSGSGTSNLPTYPSSTSPLPSDTEDDGLTQALPPPNSQSNLTSWTTHIPNETIEQLCARADLSRSHSHTILHPESPLSSSPNLAAMAVNQQWAIGDNSHDNDDWQDIGEWVTIPPDNDTPLQSSLPTQSSSDNMGQAAEIVAETLLDLHSSPIRQSPSVSSPRRKGPLARPTPLRRFTLGSSSSAMIPTSSALSMTDSFPNWPNTLDTPITLRDDYHPPAWPGIGRTESNPSEILARPKAPIIRGRLAAGERSLSFSTDMRMSKGEGGWDDPFGFSPITIQKGKENGVVGKRTLEADGSPLPNKKRAPLTTILPNPKLLPSSLSTTLSTFHNPIISPLKRLTQTPIGKSRPDARFGQSAFGLTPMTGSKGRWMLSSPAVDGIAAELGLVGAYEAYEEGSGTPGSARGGETPRKG